MSRVPEGWKRRVLPAWNGGHRLARRGREHLDALVHRRYERCRVCGRFGPMLYRRRVIPRRLEQLWGLSPRVAEALARKESCDCAWCGAKLRARRIAQVLLELYPVGARREISDSVAAWVGQRESRALRVAEINVIEGLHEALERLPLLAYSEYRPGVAPGSTVAGVRCEDLARLTYPDASFDLVLTSETLEHVPDLGAALGSIRRVLATGGRHLFTVPLLPGVAKTFPRATATPEGEIVRHAQALFHPGGDSGYPVFTEFGADLPEILERAGFEVQTFFGPTTEDDLAQVYVCKKL